MKERVLQYIHLLFEGIPYSEKLEEAKKQIEEKLIQKYNDYLQDNNPQVAFEKLIKTYPDFDSMARVVDYKEEEINHFKQMKDVITLNDIRKKVKVEKRIIIVILVLLFISLLQLFYLAPFFIGQSNLHLSKLLLGILIYGTIGILCLIGCIRLYNKYLKNPSKQEYKFDQEAYIYLREQSDDMIKSFLNWNSIFIIVLSSFIILERYGYLYILSKENEVINSVISFGPFLLIPYLFVLKHGLYLQQINQKTKYLVSDQFKKYALILTIFNLFYWFVVIMIYWIWIGKSATIFYLCCMVVLFMIITMIINLTFRKTVTKNNFVYSKKKMIIILVGCLIIGTFSYLVKDTWYTQTYINSVPVVQQNQNPIEYNEQTGVYTITATEDDFTILHLTDIHLGGSLYSYSKDLLALKAVIN